MGCLGAQASVRVGAHNDAPCVKSSTPPTVGSIDTLIPRGSGQLRSTSVAQKLNEGDQKSDRRARTGRICVRRLPAVLSARLAGNDVRCAGALAMGGRGEPEFLRGGSGRPAYALAQRVRPKLDLSRRRARLMPARLLRGRS